MGKRAAAATLAAFAAVGLAAIALVAHSSSSPGANSPIAGPIEWMPAAASDPVSPAEPLEQVLAAIQSDAAASGIDAFSVAVARPGAAPVGIAIDQRFESASAAKFYWVAAALRRKGIAAVEPYARPIFEASDNEAAASVIRLAGRDRLNGFLRDRAGMKNTAFVSWSYLDDASGASSGGPNYTTTGDAVTFLARLASGRLLARDQAAELLDWAALSPVDPVADGPAASAMANLLPAEARATVRHKAGWLTPGESSNGEALSIDIGLVALPDRSWYAVALVATHPDDLDLAAAFVAHSSCEIYRGLAALDLVCE